MALATGTALALAGTLAASGLQAYNTNRTASRQDASAAQGIRDQSRIQQKADVKVNDEVDKLASSRSGDERAQRLTDYMKTLTTARGKTNAGLENVALGDAFNAAGATAKGDLAASGNRTADLTAGVDAAGLQRQGEANSFGRLATDLGLIGRESSGQRFLTDLRTRSIRRNPWIDAGASALQGLTSAGLGGGAAAAPAASLGSGAAGIGSGLMAAMRGFGGGP